MYILIICTELIYNIYIIYIYIYIYNIYIIYIHTYIHVIYIYIYIYFFSGCNPEILGGWRFKGTGNNKRPSVLIQHAKLAPNTDGILGAL